MPAATRAASSSSTTPVIVEMSRWVASSIGTQVSSTSSESGPTTPSILPAIEEATHLDISTITGVVLEELAARVAAGMGHDLPVPFYFMIERQFFRELL